MARMLSKDCVVAEFGLVMSCMAGGVPGAAAAVRMEATPAKAAVEVAVEGGTSVEAVSCARALAAVAAVAGVRAAAALLLPELPLLALPLLELLLALALALVEREEAMELASWF